MSGITQLGYMGFAADDLDVLGFEAEDLDAFVSLAEHLGAADARVEFASEVQAQHRGVERLLRFEEPGGLTCELYTRPLQAPAPFTSDLVRGGFVAGAQGFGHVVLRARDISTSTRFFCDVLGARLSDRIFTRIGDMDVRITFLHWNRVVQTLGQHPNDKMVSFYSQTPSGFEVELGWGGRTITEGWQPETHTIWTEWGHRPPCLLACAGVRRRDR